MNLEGKAMRRLCSRRPGYQMHVAPASWTARHA